MEYLIVKITLWILTALALIHNVNHINEYMKLSAKQKKKQGVLENSIVTAIAEISLLLLLISSLYSIHMG